MIILCLTNFPVPSGKRWLWDFLPESERNEDEIDFLYTQPADYFPGWGKLLAYYPAYLWLGLRAMRQLRRKKYDIIVTWEGISGFGLALLRRLMGMYTPPMVVLAYNQRGIIRAFPALTRYAMGAVNHLTVTTKAETESLQALLGQRPDRVTFIPLGWELIPTTVPSMKIEFADRPYILSSGRSFRDYLTLVEAVRGLDGVRLVILARPFNLRGVRLPENVVSPGFLSQQQLVAVTRHARFIVLPFMDVPHATGDNSIIQAMSEGKAIIATHGYSANTYIQNEINGLVVPPGDAQSMRKAILRLWNNPAECERLGQRALQDYKSNYTVEIFITRIRSLLKQIFERANSEVA